MKSLIIKEFKGANTVKLNKGLNTNAIFFSRIQDFYGKLSHSHYALKFPVSGIEHYIVNKREYEITPKNYFVSNAGQEVEAYVQSKKEVVGICVGFTKDYISQLAKSINQELEQGLDSPFVTDNSINFIIRKNRLSDDKLSLALNRIKVDLLKNRIDNYENEQFYIFLGELLISKAFKTYSAIERLPHIKISSKKEIYRRICVMNDYIHDNYKKDITLDELAQISLLSKYHALRCYQKINNITPYSKILILRLEEAKRLIRKGMSISDVAYETNFADYRAFSKKFKRHFKMTPSQYKTRIRKK